MVSGLSATRRWLKAEALEAIVDDLRRLLRVAASRNAEPSAVIYVSRTLQSTLVNGAAAGYDGAKKARWT